MGLFKKKEKEAPKQEVSKPKELPKLPELPAFSDFNSPQISQLGEPPKDSKQLAQLPSFPTSSFGKKYSQSTIKNAVTGQEEDEEVNYNEEEEIPMTPSPLKKRVVETYDPGQKEYNFSGNPEETEKEGYGISNKNYSLSEETEQHDYSFAKKSYEPEKASKSEEPIFIRIDKFEESLKVFEQAKKQIRELENLLKETKELKQKENQELSSWESELQQLKSKIEKVDKDIFSKIK